MHEIRGGIIENPQNSDEKMKLPNFTFPDIAFQYVQVNAVRW